MRALKPALPGRPFELSDEVQQLPIPIINVVKNPTVVLITVCGLIRAHQGGARTPPQCLTLLTQPCHSVLHISMSNLNAEMLLYLLIRGTPLKDGPEKTFHSVVKSTVGTTIFKDLS